MLRRFGVALSVAAGLLGSSPALAVTIDWVTVGDPGNAPDDASNCYAASCGSVPYEYRISKYEVTNAQYAEFLNAKAAVDSLGLYHTSMADTEIAGGGITRSGTPGNYTYATVPGFENKPVTYVSFYDALRFANWLNNGQGSGDTETGAYTLLGASPVPVNAGTVSRNSGASIFLPSENEWYKAAYYDGASATYFDYPAGSNAVTSCAMPSAAPNTANCIFVGNVTDVGSYPGSPSPYGTFDQGGNVGEWNEQNVSGARGARGGSWHFPEFLLAASSPVNTFPSGSSTITGFRVASIVPEPGTAVLVGSGILGIAARRRRKAR